MMNTYSSSKVEKLASSPSGKIQGSRVVFLSLLSRCTDVLMEPSTISPLKECCLFALPQVLVLVDLLATEAKNDLEITRSIKCALKKLDSYVIDSILGRYVKGANERPCSQ